MLRLRWNCSDSDLTALLTLLAFPFASHFPVLYTTLSMANVGQGANKPYPQEVTLDAAKAEAAQMQSEASKAHGGAIPKNDPASAARVRLRNSSDRSNHAAASVQRLFLLASHLLTICVWIQYLLVAPVDH